MGLIKAITGSAMSTLGDQWKEYFYCDALTGDVVARRGHKRTAGNNKGNDNVITNGSLIAVNEGQAMMIVEDGRVLEFTAEPGGYKFDQSSSPTIFEGGLGAGIKASFAEFGRRFTQGGDVGKDQRVYYFNLKEMPGCKFGTAAGLVYDDPAYKSISIRFFGTTSLKLVDPMCFYKNVCGNITEDYRLSKYWESQLREEFVTYLGQALAMLSTAGKKYSQIPQSQIELVKYINDAVDADWTQNRGLAVHSAAIPSISLDPKDQERINRYDDMAMMSDPAMAAARIVGAQAAAMESAGKNTGGAMTGFMGMGMAQTAGGVNAADLFKMASAPAVAVGPQGSGKEVMMRAAVDQMGWACECGAHTSGKFCNECGKPKPVPVEDSAWSCSCGATTKGKFCSECGDPKPVSNDWKCTCGNTVAGKFCNECGASRA